MKKFHLSIVLVVLALVLAIVPAIFAQDDTLGASQGDYDLWTSANANMATIKTASYTFTATLEASGMGDSSGSLNVTGTGVLSTDQTNPELQLDVTGTSVQGDKTEPLNASLRIVDGVLYSNDGSGWTGRPLSDLMSQMGGMAGGAAGGDLSSLSGTKGMSDAMTALQGLKPSEFLKLTRTDESGQAHFSLNIDIAKLLASPSLAPVFGSVMGMFGGSSGASAPAMTTAQMQQAQAMIGGMFSTATISLDQYVDPASSMVARDVLAIKVPLDAMIGPGAAINVNFDISLSNYNEPISVEAPADAVMATPEATIAAQ